MRWFRANKTKSRVSVASAGVTMNSGSASNKNIVSLHTDMIA